MNMLTFNIISQIGSETRRDVTYIPATIGYIQVLLTPYAEAIEQEQNVESIRQWVRLIFKGELIRTALASLDEAIDFENMIHGHDHHIALVKAAVIENIINEIMDASAAAALSIPGNRLVLPWNVYDAISTDTELSETFSMFPINPILLPVTIIIGGESFTHNLSEEFVLGLLVFSSETGSNYGVIMFGSQLSTKDIVGEQDHIGIYRNIAYINRIYYGLDPLQYILTTIDKRRYTFQTADFLQGFATGAMWMNVDHHNYWEQLTSNYNNKTTNINF